MIRDLINKLLEASQDNKRLLELLEILNYESISSLILDIDDLSKSAYNKPLLPSKTIEDDVQTITINDLGFVINMSLTTLKKYMQNEILIPIGTKNNLYVFNEESLISFFNWFVSNKSKLTIMKKLDDINQYGVSSLNQDQRFALRIFEQIIKENEK